MVHQLLSFSLLSFGSLFAIVDPFAAVPIFLALAGDQDRSHQRKVALQASMTCFLVLSSFALAGSIIFRFFGITIPAFKIAGGFLLFGIALEMTQAKHSPTRSTAEEESEAEQRTDVGLIPLGLPLLSGPGAIATVTMLAGRCTIFEERVGLVISIVLVSAITLLTLRSASFFSRALGKTGLNIIGRIMGLILAAVAVQFLIDGVHDAFPSLRPLGG